SKRSKMHHSFFTTALLIVSNVMAQDPSLSTTGLAPGVAPGGRNQFGSSVPTVTCPSLSESSLKWPRWTQLQLHQPTPDPKTLSEVQTAAICKNADLTAVCVLNSCNITTAPAPVCQSCYEYTPNPTVMTASSVPSLPRNYNFNQTDVKTPWVCSDKKQKTFSCGSCAGARDSSTASLIQFLYAQPDIPTNPPTTNPPTTNPPTTTPTTPTPSTSPPTPITPSLPSTSNTPTTPNPVNPPTTAPATS
ncbi:hypothetical protein PSTT_08994, partial [Puccinia striiformis]